MRAEITRRAGTLTEGQAMADLYCTANRPLRVENCWPMEIEPKSEISMKPSVA
jgi:hypothetical protein